MSELIQRVREKARQWLASATIDDATKKDIERQLQQDDTKELIDNFYKDLEFGTGGLRGIMGNGSNCMNRYTLGVATQGLSNYLKKTYGNAPIRVAIAHDSRNNSNTFARITAEIFSANGIDVYLFPALRPTPLLSFAIRHLNCQSGVVITASHNPKEYNGYKAYWNDGAQVVPPHDQNIIAEVNAIRAFEEVKFSGDASRITMIGPEVEAAYYNQVKKIIPQQDIIRIHHAIPLVYSSLHGAGITMVPECLRQLGFTNVHVVAEQQEPDGNFPTVSSPNPEERSAMEMVIRKGQELNATLVMATDPDTDRVGIGIRKPSSEFVLLNGNQAFSLMMWFIMRNVKERKGAYVAKTIVTSELVDQMAANYGIACYNTLTGFKYIAALMREKEGKEKFIAAGEESYGYMVGDFVRDKDAVSACAFFATMAACAVHEGKSLYDWLLDMYTEHALFQEGLLNITKKGQQGEQEIKNMMEVFRQTPPEEITGKRVVRILDYKNQQAKDLATGKTTTIDLPPSDVMQFYCDDGTKVSVRPSGTEPKIKFYISVSSKLNSPDEYDTRVAELNQQISAIENYLKSL
jgi:phosphoglucomutase